MQTPLRTKRVLVVGGTGLVGSSLLKALTDVPEFRTKVLVRRVGALSIKTQNADSNQMPYVEEHLFDFESQKDFETLSQEHFDYVFCCLGTTRKKAGSAEQFQRVDLEYPRALIHAVRSSNPIFALISSIGADVPRGLYLNTKAQLETELRSSGLRYVIVRPSLLLGERSEFRLTEALAAKLFGSLAGFLRDHLGAGLAKYAPISADIVAHALLNGSLWVETHSENLILEGRPLFEFGSKKVNSPAICG
jgi:uncharacterized protein YbjT (DUF2867 family)